MNAQEIAEKQDLTILSKEGENTFLCASETESGDIYLACWNIWDDELHRTIDRGQVYTREGINKIPHVADLLAALEEVASGPCCESPGCSIDEPFCSTMVARAAITGTEKGE